MVINIQYKILLAVVIYLYAISSLASTLSFSGEKLVMVNVYVEQEAKGYYSALVEVESLLEKDSLNFSTSFFSIHSIEQRVPLLFSDYIPMYKNIPLDVIRPEFNTDISHKIKKFISMEPRTSVYFRFGLTKYYDLSFDKTYWAGFPFGFTYGNKEVVSDLVMKINLIKYSEIGKLYPVDVHFERVGVFEMSEGGTVNYLE